MCAVDEVSLKLTSLYCGVNCFDYQSHLALLLIMMMSTVCFI